MQIKQLITFYLFYFFQAWLKKNPEFHSVDSWLFCWSTTIKCNTHKNKKQKCKIFTNPDCCRLLCNDQNRIFHWFGNHFTFDRPFAFLLFLVHMHESSVQSVLLPFFFWLFHFRSSTSGVTFAVLFASLWIDKFNWSPQFIPNMQLARLSALLFPDTGTNQFFFLSLSGWAFFNTV